MRFLPLRLFTRLEHTTAFTLRLFAYIEAEPLNALLHPSLVLLEQTPCIENEESSLTLGALFKT